MAPDFLNLVDIEELVIYLMGEGAIGRDEVIEITAHISRARAVRILIVMLSTKGDDVLPKLVLSLHKATRHLGHHQLLQLVLEEFREHKYGMQALHFRLLALFIKRLD